MILACFLVAGGAFLVNVFTAPGNGHVLYTVYYMLYAIAFAGINSALMNLIFDYVPHEQRTAALAFQRTVYGFSGFFTTLLASLLVSYIQARGNTLFGLPLYTQQVMSALACFLVLGLCIFVKCSIIKKTPTGKE
jgi:MFS family permease